MSPRPRLGPDWPFPERPYVPGRTPRPRSGPIAPEGPDGETQSFRHAIDLFNAGFHWEAHEHWEALWARAGRVGPWADFLKGLIKLTAAGVKAQQGCPDGTRAHAARAAELFRAAALGIGTATVAGLDLAGLVCLAEGITREGWPAVPPELWPSA